MLKNRIFQHVKNEIYENVKHSFISFSKSDDTLIIIHRPLNAASISRE